MCTFRGVKNLITKRKKKPKRGETASVRHREGVGGKEGVRAATAGFEGVYSNDISVEPTTISRFSTYF